MIKKISTKLALLLGVVALNIYPMGCFTWGSGTVVPVVSSVPAPTDYMINKDNYLKALDCADGLATTSAKDKEYIANKKQQLKASTANPYFETYTEIDSFKTKYPTCNFN